MKSSTPIRIWLLSFALIFLIHSVACSYRNVRVGSNSSSEQQPAIEDLEPARSLPKPQGFVNDFAGVIDEETQQQLEMKLIQLKNRSAIEFAVVTVETTGGQSIFDYSLALARQWKVGPKDSVGGGLLYLLAVKDRTWRIQVSRGLEKDLPNDVCKAMGDKSTELFQQKKFSEGIVNFVDSIIEHLGKVNKSQTSAPVQE